MVDKIMVIVNIYIFIISLKDICKRVLMIYRAKEDFPLRYNISECYKKGIIICLLDIIQNFTLIQIAVINIETCLGLSISGTVYFWLLVAAVINCIICTFYSIKHLHILTLFYEKYGNVKKED